MTASETALNKLLTDHGYRVLRGGWPDYFVTPGDGGPGFAVELKAGGDQVRPHQRAMHDALEAAGVKVLVAKAGGVERLPAEITTTPMVPPEDAMAVLRDPAVDKYMRGLFFKELGRHGGTKRMASLSAEQKTALGKKAARAKKAKRRAKAAK